MSNKLVANVLKAAAALTLLGSATAAFAQNPAPVPAPAVQKPVSQEVAEKRAKDQIVNLNLNFNSFQSQRDYENFIQSRSKQLKRKSNDELRDVDVKAQPVDENSVVINKFNLVAKNGENFAILRTLAKEAAKYEGERFTARKIAALLNNLTNMVLRAGYATTVVYVDGNDAFDGNTLKVTVLFGKVGEVRAAVDQGSLKDKLMTKTLPSFPGGVLRIDVIDQIVDVLTTVNKDVSVDVVASPNKAASSDLLINVNRTYKPALSLGINNATNTGVYQANAYLSAGDVIGINDSWTLGLIKRLHHTEGRKTEILSASYTQPLGRFEFKTDYSFLRNYNLLEGKSDNGEAQKYQSRFYKHDVTFQLGVTAYRSQTQVGTVYAALNHVGQRSVVDNVTDANNVANITFTPTGSTEGKLGVSWLDNNLLGGRFFLDASYVQSLQFWDGDADVLEAAKIAPTKAEYEAGTDPKVSAYEAARKNGEYYKGLNLLADYSRNFQVKNVFLQYSGRAKATFSFNGPAFGRFTASGAYDMRGLREESVSGQNGFGLKNDLGPLFQFDNKFLRTVKPYVGLDLAYAWTPAYKYSDAEQQRTGNTADLEFSSSYAVSLGAGVELSGNHWRLSGYVGSPVAADGFGSTPKLNDAGNKYLKADGTETTERGEAELVKIEPHFWQGYVNLSLSF